MIFKNIEIYFLYASSKARWAITFGLLLAIVGLWWRFAFSPMRQKLIRAHYAFNNSCAESQEIDRQALLDGINQKSIAHRIAFSGDYNHFLKDLMQHGLITTHVAIDSPLSLSKSSVTETHIKLSFTGNFSKFYEFLKDQQKNYLCSWNSCTISTNPEHTLTFDADINLYYKQ